MSQSRHFIAATAFVLAGMLVSPIGKTAPVTQLHVHLQIRSSCSVHIDPHSARAPDVSCSRGQPAFAVNHVASQAQLEPRASVANVAVHDGATTTSPKVWVITF